MPNRDTTIGRQYETAVFDRATPQDVRWITHHEVNWADQPSRVKIYPGARRLPLENGLGDARSFADVLAGGDEGDAPLTYARLSHLLFLTNGILGRRMDLNWNDDALYRVTRSVTYARPAASGGGMYPYELYFVAGARGSIAPGVYHYSNAHHALDALRPGDWTAPVREALGDHRWAADVDGFILISVNFWKNSFKYATFCYHVVSQDIGLAVAALRLTARSIDVPARVLYWFDDEWLNRLVGLETLEESVFAVVALGRRSSEARRHISPSVARAPAIPPLAMPAFQRSKQIKRFPFVEAVHEGALVGAEARPGPDAASHAAMPVESTGRGVVSLPASDEAAMTTDLAGTFRARSSSFGSFRAGRGLPLRDLATILKCGSLGQTWPSDVTPEEPIVRFTRATVFVNHVRDLERGIYDYLPDAHALLCRRLGDYRARLQDHYYLRNYNLEQASAAIVVNGSLDRMLATYGNRGIRILNAEVGHVAQHVYMACAACEVGCGALLGFDNPLINRMAGFSSDEHSLLMIAVGPQVTKPVMFDYRLG